MKTAIIGASPHSYRYSYVATLRLMENGHEVVPLGINPGQIGETTIEDLRARKAYQNIDTVTMYLAPENQSEWIDYILSLRPRRIVFNPGAENPEFERRGQSENIEIINACTLVMLSAGTY